MTMEELNGLARERFVAAVGHAFEHSPWVAQRAWAQRPFRDVTDLHAKMLAVLAAAAEAERLELLRAHPDLVGRLARFYGTHLIPVTNLIHGKPVSRIREFADAFKLRKDR